MKKRKKILPANPITDKPIKESTHPYHIPVLLKEVIEALNIKADGIYVDCTFGGGGHARAILERLSEKGKLVAFDQDEAAKQNLPTGQAGLPDDPRIIFIQQNFRHLQRFLRLHNIGETDGILADLGVSSYQFDEANRGFSIRNDADLDMRMDTRQQLTAYEVIKTYSEEQLHRIFEQYGEVTNSKTLARTIVKLRSSVSLQTIEGFRNALREIVKGNPNRYFAQVFQALRIEVNDELGALRELLQQAPNLLKPSGRIAIITFHSLEDRLVKVFFRRGSFDEPDENPFINSEKKMELRPVNKKPVLPSADEIKLNKRARSAKLRIAEKVGVESRES